MSAPTIDLKRIDADTIEAMAALHGARAAAWRSPNADNKAAAERAEQRVNELLDARLSVTR